MESKKRYVLKFGGSSLADLNKIEKVASFISHFSKSKADELIVVVSAMGKTTSRLLSAANTLNKKAPSSLVSLLVSQGENISASALSIALSKHSVESRVLHSSRIKINVMGEPQNAIISSIDKEKILEELKSGKVVIVPGFQGESVTGETYTLGRGGSDATAIALGATLNAKVFIYTDVEGYKSTDPSLGLKVKNIQNLEIHKAIELSSTGAKIMQQRSLEIANKNNVKVSVLKSMSDKGTKITKNCLESFSVEAISFKNNLLMLEATTNKIQEILQKTQNVPLNILYYDEFYNKNAQLLRIISDNLFTKQELANFKNNNIKTKPVELITIVGSGLLSDKNFLFKLQYIMKNMVFYTYFTQISPTCIKIAVKPKNALSLVKILHKEFIE